MWNPVYIKFENLFSHKNSEYNFKNDTCTVIVGKNETDEGFENNGSGKSTIVEAIVIAYTGESCRAIKKEEFINLEEEFSTVEFYLENPLYNNSLLIKRKFFRGNKASLVEVYENGKLNEQLVSVLEANKRIIELVGISKDDFLRYFIIHQDCKYTFFTANDVEKKEIMNRITSADMINPAIEELSSRAKNNKIELDSRNNSLIEINGKIDVYKDEIEEEKTKTNILEEKKKLTEGIENIKSSIEEEVKNISQLNEEELKLQNQLKIKRGKVIDVNSIKEKLRKCRSEINETKELISDLQIMIDGVIECPKCNHEFTLNSEYELSVPEARVLIEDTKMVLDNLNEDKISFDNEIKKADELEEEISQIDSSIRKLKRKIQISEDNKKDLEDDLKKINIKLLELEKNSENKRIKLLEGKIDVLELEAKKIRGEIRVIEEEKEMISFWQYNMGKTGFTTYLANKSIKIIEGLTNSFLRKFKTELSVLINGFKILKSGEIREKIDVFIQTNGIDTKTFTGNSGGERGRINLAGILAINHLLKISSDGGSLNLIVLDETFPGIDPLGQESIIKILENLGITILMITQVVSPNFNNENTLYVKKVDGISHFTNVI